MGKKVIIVGGVAGGASAAARLRRLDEHAEIILFERDDYISYANCGLPYYIGEIIKERRKLLVQTPETMKARFAIDVRNNSEVINIDANKKFVTVNNKEKGKYTESYDYLILSPGAKALIPSIPGVDNERIFTLRNIHDTDKIKNYVDSSLVSSAIVIGGGFVGIEMAENLQKRGLKVTLIEAAPHILAPLDSDMAVLVEKEIVDNGVQLILNDAVKSFVSNGNQLEAILKSNRQLTADIIILAVGVIPDTDFLKGSGIKLGIKGHILVNEKMETNLKNIYAVGDAVEVVDFVTKSNTAIPLAGPANKQGRIAADNVAGLNSTYKGSQGTSIIKVFRLTAANTGANEKTLKKKGIPYKAVIIHPASHATYYPGAAPLTLKLIFSDEGKVLGAQAVGFDGVDKRIDVISAVIRLNGTVYDLTELETAYAPPYTSAKDPVNMAGFVAQNVIEGRSHVITWEEFEGMDKDDYTLLDVRTDIEYKNGHIEGAVNIPVDNLRSRIKELKKDKVIVLYCQVGLRAYIAERILYQNGFKVFNITGGYKTASALGFSPESKGNGDTGSKASSVTINPDTQVVK